RVSATHFFAGSGTSRGSRLRAPADAGRRYRACRARGHLLIAWRVSMARTLFQKVWDAHTVRTLPNGQTQLYIGLHLVHEVTSPQAFAELRERVWTVKAPERTFATIDHIVPTAAQARPFADVMAESMTAALERNCRDYGIKFFDLGSGGQGIVHVIGPE